MDILTREQFNKIMANTTIEPTDELYQVYVDNMMSKQQVEQQVDEPNPPYYETSGQMFPNWFNKRFDTQNQAISCARKLKQRGFKKVSVYRYEGGNVIRIKF